MPTITRDSLEFEFPALKEAQGKLDAKRKEVADVLAEAADDQGNYDAKKVKSQSFKDGGELATWCQTRNLEIDDLKKEADRLWQIAKAAQNGADGAEPGSEPGAGEPGTKGGKVIVKSLGEMFTESKAFKAWTGGQSQVAAVEYDLKADFTTSAGWAPESVRSGVVSMFPTRPAPFVVDLIPQAPINQAVYKFMEETTFTNAAAERAEGGTYPEGALELTERSRTVEKIPVWLPVTDEQLEDVPGVRAYLDNRLTFMVRQRLDSQVLVGNGTTPNILGTENVVGIQTQALGGDPVPDAIYKLFRQIREDGFAEPTAVFIRPSKWESVRLLKTADGMYIWGHPSTPGPTTIWGVPVAETTAVTATKAVAGDYQMHSLLSIRRGVDIQITNAHSDFFINGKQAIRADMRVVMVHFRPKAFGNVTGL